MVSRVCYQIDHSEFWKLFFVTKELNMCYSYTEGDKIKINAWKEFYEMNEMRSLVADQIGRIEFNFGRSMM